MTSQLTHTEVASWPLATGDRVVIVERRLAGSPPESTVTRSWTFHVRAANGRKIAGGGETFSSKWNAKRAAARSFPPVEQ